MLDIEGLNAWYGHSHVLQGVSLAVDKGEIVTLIGRNGAGKTTTLRTVMGLVAKKSGRVMFDGADAARRARVPALSPRARAVPEERRIVPGLSVLENLQLGLLASPHRKREGEIIERIAADVSAPETAARAVGRNFIGRRAADAGDRARDDGRA